ncbi:MATE family efflux transporter [Vibrio panuliri]|uniref:Multidrug resistance protein NorM n=1 Tax=Vibrio panuliri TaxID=1381081 RepID=A0A1Q9HF63_9VIBR|nr:MATE family efflux transporter [Vibrio panuliri]OLQ88356.1 MATE family efflux transporter [Vibrio panuliri]
MHRYKQEAATLIKLATPVLIASVAQTGMSFVDTVMAGGVSATDMAAVSIASSIWLPSILFGVGLLMALVPIVAQLNGSAKYQDIPNEVQQGIYMALFISLPIIAVFFQTQGILRLMDVEPSMGSKTIGYMNAVMFAVPAYLLFQALRCFTDGLSLTKPAMFIGFVGLLCNIPLNWIFVYGKFGAPALGGVGCGVATAIVYWLMFSMMLLYVLTAKRVAYINLFGALHKPRLQAQVRLFKLGFPVAAALFFEVTLFAVVALLIAPLGPMIVAAHQIAINFSSLVFMLPMSIGVATSIRVGYRLGEQQVDQARVASRVGLFVALGLASCTALLTIVLRQHIAVLYTDNPQVIAIALQLLLLAAIYQCTDALQVVAAAALRGYKDMAAIFKRTFIAYWIIGLPSGYILAMTDWIVEPLGVHGFWYGFLIGLTSAAIMLCVRLRWIHKQPAEYQLRSLTR